MRRGRTQQYAYVLKMYGRVKRKEILQNGKLLNINKGTVYKEKLTLIIKHIWEI
jgi:hypothetical protein